MKATNLLTKRGKMSAFAIRTGRVECLDKNYSVRLSLYKGQYMVYCVENEAYHFYPTVKEARQAAAIVANTGKFPTQKRK